ncbi:unnamed protein product [Callosobruchus maculatus]|uniref:Luciferin 4-monooxygenase n=1 Tax=Callosobruchus maculatus TaxID=64391 RepID=A0A653CAV3_CALMS|nr:unnamed protein product [Callosobruchus maculatus]
MAEYIRKSYSINTYRFSVQKEHELFPLQKMSVFDRSFVICGPEPHEPLPKDNVGQIFYQNLIAAPKDLKVMVDSKSGKTLTARELLEEACNLAEALRRYGCHPGTPVSVCSENTLKFFIPVVASFMAGTVLVPLNHIYTTEELKHSLSITQPKIVFCSKKALPKFKKLQKELHFIDTFVVLDNGDRSDDVFSLSGFISKMLNGNRLQPEYFRPFDGDPKEHTALVLCSSGTTGLPKGVMLTHFNIATRIVQARDPRYLTHNNVVLGLMPFYHAYGLYFGITSILNHHLTVMIDRFDEDSFLKAIQTYRISVVRVTPPLVILLAKSKKLENYDLSSVAEVFCAGAPLSAETEIELKKRLNIKTIHQAYGCTEGTLALTIMDKDVYRPGSCGQVITYMCCTVRSPETGHVLGPRQVGELCFKGPLVMKGYYKNPQATKESFTADGWLRTGDLGYYDEENYFYIVDRLKELIKFKGYQVAPAELEAILLKHPKVLDAAVVGLPDEMAGELPLAFVIKKPREEVTATELQQYVAEHVSPQKRLRGGVIFTTSIPKNPSGKILRRDLKQRLKDYKPNLDSKL